MQTANHHLGFVSIRCWYPERLDSLHTRKFRQQPTLLKGPIIDNRLLSTINPLKSSFFVNEVKCAQISVCILNIKEQQRACCVLTSEVDINPITLSNPWLKFMGHIRTRGWKQTRGCMIFSLILLKLAYLDVNIRQLCVRPGLTRFGGVRTAVSLDRWMMCALGGAKWQIIVFTFNDWTVRDDILLILSTI